MPVTDTTMLDFSQADGHAPQTLRVHNPDPRAVLHALLRTASLYIDLFPAEFALAPGEAQTVTAILRPERAGNKALAAGTVSLLAQFIALHPEDEAALPPDVERTFPLILPGAACPHCGAELPDGAAECRRCGERVRPCPVCGTPNSWLARTCRVNPTHIQRTEPDWSHSPGGNAAHALPCPAPAGTHLARVWSVPAFPRTNGTDEWAAPLVAFGMTFGTWTDTAASVAKVAAWETASGAALWEFPLPGTQGLYPDRGALALSEDGTLYAATLPGDVTAIDAVRGTRKWTAKAPGAVYGGVTVGGDSLLVPAGNALCILDRDTGTLRHTVTLGGRLDTAPAWAFDTAFCACDDGRVYAVSVQTGAVLWETPCAGTFDAAPVVHNALVLVATMTGTVLGLNAATGAPVWRVHVTDKGIAAALCVTPDGLLLVGDDGGVLHVLDASTGNVLRSRSITNAPLRVSPACGGRTVFVGADDGSVYSLDAAWSVSRVYETVPGARILGAGFALSGDTLAFACTNGALYVCRATP